LENLGIDEEVMSQYMLKKYDVKAWSELIWLRTGTRGRLLL
jgi:hypothetical protein